MIDKGLVLQIFIHEADTAIQSIVGPEGSSMRHDAPPIMSTLQSHTMAHTRAKALASPP